MSSRFLYSVIRFVPDPARGEFVNVGAIVGSDETADWKFRVIDNMRRARLLDDANRLPNAIALIDSAVGARVDAFQALLDSDNLVTPVSESEIDQAWLRRLHDGHQNVVQFSLPAPVVAESAEIALDMIFDELLVDPHQESLRFKKKSTAAAVVRKSYEKMGLKKGRDYFERQRVRSAHHEETFDFVVANGKALQLTHAWSFQVPDQVSIAESVKAWAWSVGDLRKNGGELESSRGLIQVPATIDVEVLFIPPKPEQGQRVLDEARSAFQQLNVHAVEVDGVDELTKRLALNIHKNQQP